MSAAEAREVLSACGWHRVPSDESREVLAAEEGLRPSGLAPTASVVNPWPFSVNTWLEREVQPLAGSPGLSPIAQGDATPPIEMRLAPQASAMPPALCAMPAGTGWTWTPDGWLQRDELGAELEEGELEEPAPTPPGRSPVAGPVPRTRDAVADLHSAEDSARYDIEMAEINRLPEGLGLARESLQRYRDLYYAWGPGPVPERFAHPTDLLRRLRLLEQAA
jgi:hypothetical protein